MFFLCAGASDGNLVIHHSFLFQTQTPPSAAPRTTHMPPATHQLFERLSHALRSNGDGEAARALLTEAVEACTDEGEETEVLHRLLAMHTHDRTHRTLTHSPLTHSPVLRQTPLKPRPCWRACLKPSALVATMQRCVTQQQAWLCACLLMLAWLCLTTLLTQLMTGCPRRHAAGAVAYSRQPGVALRSML